jgi:hypothetical protein
MHRSFGEMTRVQRQSRADAQTLFELAGVGHHVDEELVSHLTNLYFTWQNPSLYVVDQAAFERARNDYNETQIESSLYSKFLVNAM